MKPWTKLGFPSDASSLCFLSPFFVNALAIFCKWARLINQLCSTKGAAASNVLLPKATFTEAPETRTAPADYYRNPPREQGKVVRATDLSRGLSWRLPKPAPECSNGQLLCRRTRLKFMEWLLQQSQVLKILLERGALLAGQLLLR